MNHVLVEDMLLRNLKHQKSQSQSSSLRRVASASNLQEEVQRMVSLRFNETSSRSTVDQPHDPYLQRNLASEG